MLGPASYMGDMDGPAGYMLGPASYIVDMDGPAGYMLGPASYMLDSPAGYMVAHVILVSPQSQLDFNLDLDLALGSDLGLRGLDLGLPLATKAPKKQLAHQGLIRTLF